MSEARTGLEVNFIDQRVVSAAVESSTTSNSEVPVGVQVLRFIQLSPIPNILYFEYGIDPKEMEGRIIEVAELVTADLGKAEKKSFWRGLEIGASTGNIRPKTPISTEKIAREDNFFLAQNNAEFQRSDSRGWAHRRGYLVGAEMCGISLASDAIIDFATREGMSPCEVEKKINPDDILGKADEFMLNSTRMGISLRPGRRNVSPTIDASLRTQLYILRQAYSLNDKKENSK